MQHTTQTIPIRKVTLCSISFCCLRTMQSLVPDIADASWGCSSCTSCQLTHHHNHAMGRKSYCQQYRNYVKSVENALSLGHEDHPDCIRLAEIVYCLLILNMLHKYRSEMNIDRFWQKPCTIPVDMSCSCLVAVAPGCQPCIIVVDQRSHTCHTMQKPRAVLH